LKILNKIHPYLFAIYPVLGLFAGNIGEFSGELVVRSLFICVIFSSILFLAWRLGVGSWRTAAILTTSSQMLIFSYGHLYNILKPMELLGVNLGRHRLLLPSYLIIFTVWIIWINRRNEYAKQINQFLSITGAILIVFPLFTLSSYFLRSNQNQTFDAIQTGNDVSAALIPKASANPDIYYIILDAYGRQDVLNEIYQFDNTSFINFLEDSGFYVAKESQSNYSTTVKSLTATLHLNYLDTLIDEYNIDPTELKFALRQNRVRAFLEARGYQSVSFDSGWENTRIRESDFYLHTGAAVQPPPYLSWTLNEFELLLIRSTLLRAYYDFRLQRIGTGEESLGTLHQKHRERILYTFQKLEEIPDWEGDYFVFAHIISPHPPFVFGPNGEPRNPDWDYTMQDGDAFPGTTENYIKGYRSQIEYLNKLLMRSIRVIQNKSEQPPIIIIQGDHGPRALFDWDSAENSNLKEAMSILNAYYLPGQVGTGLYPSISPVNSFRLVFNLYFETDFVLLEDSSYFTTQKYPFDFIAVDTSGD
jgi:hypothetical protein